MIKSVAEKAQAARKRLLKEDSKGDGAEAAAADADDDDEAPFDREVLEADAKKYETLWTEFGKALKLGALTPRLATGCLVSPGGPNQIDVVHSLQT